MKTQNRIRIGRRRGSILAIAIIAASLGAAIIGYLLKYVSQDALVVEKQVGHMKGMQVVKLSANLYNTTVANNAGTLSDSQLDQLTEMIGGSGSAKPIFGSSGSGIDSSIPGFHQFTVAWDQTYVPAGTTLQPPTGNSGFWFFPGNMVSTILATHTGSDVPSTRQGAEARLSSDNATRKIPVFSMLSFYDRDWEISADYESGQCIGLIHSNGSIYLDCRASGPDRISFRGLEDYPVLSANNAVYRRGRNGVTSSGSFGTGALAGLDFYIYSTADFNSLIGTDLNYWDNGNDIAYRDLTPDYTSYEDAPSNTETAEEIYRRRYGGGTIGDAFGYVFTGASSISGTIFNTRNSGAALPIVNFGNAVDELVPPVSINPYQYIEDIQFEDTPDTINYTSPTDSNYNEDNASGLKIQGLAYNSIAPLVIRDGVAYYRTTPGGSLSPILNLIGGTAAAAYPDGSHSDARRYGDLRWYGHFGQNDGVAASPDNPDRWHFPIKSVTLNATTDANNTADATTSTEGTAVPFTFNSATVHNPVADAMTGGALPANKPHFITRSDDLNDITGYPGNNTNAGDAETGAGVGMWNVSYPVINGGGNIERYDPVRVAYNLVKAEVRRRYNAHHIYTSRHNGVKMLDANGGDPGTDPPNIWGAGITAASFGGGTDYDNADGDGNPATGDKEWSAFWNDDGAFVPFFGILPAWNGLTNTYDKAFDGDDATYYDANAADDAYTGIDLGAGNEKIISKIRFLPRVGWNTRMNGGKFQGSNTSSSSGYTDLYTIPGNPAAGVWTEVAIGSLTAYRYLRYLSPAGGHCNVAGIEFFDDTNTQITFNTDDIGAKRNYTYTRDQGTTNTDARAGILLPDGGDDTTPKVEIFPIRHDSVIDTGTAPNSPQDWYIYKSTLPLANRTLPMPLDGNTLDGFNYDNAYPGRILDNDNYPAPGSKINARTQNFGFAGASQGGLPSTDANVYDNDTSDNPSFHNWYTLLNNAPEMLARYGNNSATNDGVTFEQDFGYYAGDAGGYYGNDNLCMIDAQEKKIVVFTEIDLAELTEECLTFNNLDAAWGFTFDNNTATATTPDQLQNIIYVVNTSMGTNFFGRRVHCGAIRLKRGRLMTHSLAIASPNSVHIWGDFNSPGYWHHSKSNDGLAVDYNVPGTREHTGTVVPKQSVAIYADSVHAYENNWIPFDVTNTASDSILDQGYGRFTNTSGDNGSEIYFDHKLWWEDDGMRRSGTTSPTATPTISNNGAQLFLNYHETILNHNNNDAYAQDGAWGRGLSSMIYKHIPQGISAALMYGNVESRMPSYFSAVDVSNIPLSRPTGINALDWYMSWIDRNSWVECTRDELLPTLAGTVNNGGLAVGAPFQAATLTPGNYYGTNFPGSGALEWENCKLKFSGGGFLYDIRYHTNHTHNLAEWHNGHQTFGKNILGSFACLFSSRQATHGWNTTVPGSEKQQVFHAFDTAFFDAASLPPGTPMTTTIPGINYTIRGEKWAYD